MVWRKWGRSQSKLRVIKLRDGKRKIIIEAIIRIWQDYNKKFWNPAVDRANWLQHVSEEQNQEENGHD